MVLADGLTELPLFKQLVALFLAGVAVFVALCIVWTVRIGHWLDRRKRK
jgi:uncharacterized membrane protein YedE/YeeE